MAMIGQKIGFGPNWPHLATEGGAKWGPKVKISKIWLHHCSKLPKRSLPCEYGNDRAKNRIWPRLAPIGTFRGAKRGLRVDFYQIWLQIHSKHAPKSAWCEFGKNRTNFTKKINFSMKRKVKKILTFYQPCLWWRLFHLLQRAEAP